MKQTHQSFSISFLCGPPGSGKSYICTRDVIERLISSDFTIVTNLPLNIETIAEYVAKKRGCEPEDVSRRIEKLDASMLSGWHDGLCGPWELGKRDNCDLILDECHLFCKKGARGDRHDKWEKWLGEVRHMGWRRLVFVTQAEQKVGKPITVHAELRFELINCERLRDPFLKIPLGDWYEFIASFTREYNVAVALVEYRNVKGRMKQQHVDRVRLDPAWFKFYDSYSAAGGGAKDGESGAVVQREYQKRPTFWMRRVDGRRVLPVWLWLLRRHWWRFVIAGGAASAMVWALSGGMGPLMKIYLQKIVAMARQNRAATAEEKKQDGPSTGGVSKIASKAFDMSRQVEGSRSSSKSQSGGDKESTKSLALIVDELPEADRAVVVQRFDESRDRLAGVEAELAEVKERIEADRAEVFITAITADRIWLSTGGIYRKGETCYEEVLRGRRVVRVDVANRRAFLSDGSVLRFGASAAGVSVPAAAGEYLKSGRGTVEPGVPKSISVVDPKRIDYGDKLDGAKPGDAERGRDETR